MRELYSIHRDPETMQPELYLQNENSEYCTPHKFGCTEDELKLMNIYQTLKDRSGMFIPSVTMEFIASQYGQMDPGGYFTMCNLFLANSYGMQTMMTSEFMNRFYYMTSSVPEMLPVAAMFPSEELLAKVLTMPLELS